MTEEATKNVAKVCYIVIEAKFNYDKPGLIILSARNLFNCDPK